jgi:protein O-mannosyl-transferase
LANPSKTDLAPMPFESRSCFRTAMVSLLLFACTFALFSRAIGYGFLDYDDPDYVTQNLHVQSGFTWANIHWAFTTGHAANWHPLTWLSHMLDWKLFGNHASGHHATSIFIHSLNAVLVFLVFRKLTGAFWTSALTAALFAWHPLRVESVVWIAERKDVLSGFFGLATIGFYAAYVQSKERYSTIYFYFLAWLSLGAGLLCKPMLVTMPCVLLLLDFWPLKRLEDFSKCGPVILEKIPFLILSIVSSIVTYRVQKAGGAVVTSLGLFPRLVNSTVAVALYLEKFFWPFKLAVGYPLPDRWPNSTVAMAIFLLVLITFIALFQWRQRSWIFVGWFWFLGMLVPVIGLVKVGLQSMADRYTYLPMLGVELAILWTLREWVAKPVSRKIKIIVILILVCCAARTWNQIALWRNAYVLYGHALDVTPNNYLADCYLGSVLTNGGRYDEAIFHFRRAIDIKPDYADARCKLGVVFEKTGRLEEAADEYQRVLKDRPDYAQAQYGLAVILLDENDAAAAMPHLQIALRLDPDDDANWLAAGLANAKLDQTQAAIDCFDHAINLNPNNAQAHYDKANALDKLNREPEALAEYDRAIQINPDFDEAYNNKANVLSKTGHQADAVAVYRQAISLNAKNAGAYFGLGSALEDLGQLGEAQAAYEQAVLLEPGLTDAQYNLGAILLNANHAEEAIGHFHAAIESQIDDEPAYLGLGLAENQLGQTRQAIADFQRAIALNAEDADAHFYLGMALNSVGRQREALAEWKQVQRLNPDYPGLASQLQQAEAASTQTTQPQTAKAQTQPAGN